jgi:alpha-N-arabinofuranosidase
VVAGGDGTPLRPFATISAAALVAQPGDVVTVHEGVYRERVNPPRGGESDSKRIVYQAAPGEQVVIKGSEIVRGWVKLREHVWKLILPSSFFGDYNPFADVIQGEWHAHRGYPRHTGSVYVNGAWMDEARELDDVLAPIGDRPYWWAEVAEDRVTIWAQFDRIDPNVETVEINVRPCVIYPDAPGRNYITIRGFTLRHAATPWSGAMSEQVGLVGTHWSKGWIIEENVISHSMNTGITLGRYDLDRYGIALPPATAPGFVESIALALKHGWSQARIGSHVVRNNHISHCEKNGIHGSLGGVFSTIEGNTICDIAQRGWIGGPDVAGLKLLGSQDVLIRNNHIFRCGAVGGIWLDWMAQGTRVTGNLLHDNSRDLFMEVNHGPFLIDHNLFLSADALRDWSQGGAYVHNLFAGVLTSRKEARETPHFQPHSLRGMKLSSIQSKDLRFYNNLFVGRANLSAFSALNNVRAAGNAILAGLQTYLHPRDDGLWIWLPDEFAAITSEHPDVVTSELLGQAMIPGGRFENRDGRPYRLDTDYFGRPRHAEHLAAGPFELRGDELNSAPERQAVIGDRALGGKVADYPNVPIDGTEDDRLYQSCRYDLDGYDLLLPNGTYRATLKFCEPHFSERGKRVFDVRLQGQTVLQDFDIFAEAGQFNACDKAFDVVVTDGVLKLTIVHRVSMACFSGIEVRGSAAFKGINCGGGPWRDFLPDPGDPGTLPSGRIRVKVWPRD